MLDEIKDWVENYYNNDYTFDDKGFINIINRFAPILEEFSDEDAIIVNQVLNVILDKYSVKDYFYVVELFEYEFIPLFI